MNTKLLTPPATDHVMALIRGELSSPRRWFYRAMLLVASVGLAAIVSLWTTEPGSLPARLHVAFGALSAINLAWIAVTSWILWRRRCPTAIDRIATGWVATVACILFLLVAVPIAIMRGEGQSPVWLALVGGAMLSVAVMLLRSAYTLRRELLVKLVELERTQ